MILRELCIEIMLHLYHETIYSVQKLYTFLNCYVDTQSSFKNKKDTFFGRMYVQKPVDDGF